MGSIAESDSSLCSCNPFSSPTDPKLCRNADDELEQLLQALELSVEGVPLPVRAWVRKKARERARQMSAQIFEEAFAGCGEYLPDTDIPQKLCQDTGADSLFSMTWDALRCNTSTMNQDGSAQDDDSLTAQPGMGSSKSPFLSFAIYSLSCTSSTPPARSDIITMETEDWEDELKEGSSCD